MITAPTWDAVKKKEPEVSDESAVAQNINKVIAPSSVRRVIRKDGK